MRSTRTTHSAPAHTPKYVPVLPAWGRGADGPPPESGGKASDEDRRYKSAWGIARLRSPYLHMLDLPQRVSPRDWAEARAIADRIQSALSVGGRWTKSERGRLRVLLGGWERRASGADTVFNLRGWCASSPSAGREGWAGREKDRRFGLAMDDIRRTIGDGQ